MKFEPITPERFANTRIGRQTGWQHAAGLPVVPIAHGELAKVAAHYPICFAKLAANRPPVPCAALGLEGQKNAFVGPDGRWRGGYIPAMIRRYPFSMIKAQADGSAGEKERLAVLIDVESDMLLEAPAEGQALFDENGQKTEYFEKTLSFLTQVHRQLQRLEDLGAAIAEAGILEPVTIGRPEEISEQESWAPLQGIQRVNEGKLNALSDDAFLDLRRKGALSVVYLSLGTSGQWEKLRSFHILARRGAARAAEESDGIDLEGDEEDFVLSFES